MAEASKPADLYVGVIDIFSILLPGAVVTWICWVWLGDGGCPRCVPEGETAKILAFIFLAYAVGHLVFMVASMVDPTYDWFGRKAIERILGPRRVAPDRNALAAAIALRVASLDAELAPPRQTPSAEEHEAAARALKWARAVLHKTGSGPTIPEPTNTFQWSRAVLRLRAPAALTEVLRLEADSKFFRSLFVILVLLAIASPFTNLPPEYKWIAIPISLVLASLSYGRYAEQRQKSVIASYRSVIVLFTSGIVPVPEGRTEAEGVEPRLSQVG
ncbi:MAG TPA: hypothetical protein VGG57_20820 [Stellaceae bacterium]